MKVRIKLSTILTLYTVFLGILGVALMLTGDCTAHYVITALLGLLGLANVKLVNLLCNGEAAIKRVAEHMEKGQTEREEEHETNKDR